MADALAGADDARHPSQLPDIKDPKLKSVNLFSMLVRIKDKLTDLRGNRLLQNDFINILCEINSDRARTPNRFWKKKAQTHRDRVLY